MAKKKKEIVPECGNCFFHRIPQRKVFANSGVECRRFPPGQSGTQQKPALYPFPLVNATKWCGEHKPELKKG